MNKIYTIFLSIFLAANSVTLFALDEDEIENRNLEIQFQPTYAVPFSQEKDDQYFAELLRNIIKLDQEVHHDPMSIMKQQTKGQSEKSLSFPEYLIYDKSRYILVNQDKSFGWSAPGAIISALWHNGAAVTPNEIIVTIEKSEEFPGKYKAIIKGNGLYPHAQNRVKSAQSELTHFINNGPVEISKYERLENISSFKKIKTEKDIIKKKLPTLQGHVKCDKYFHGTDIAGTIYFDGIVAAYLLQEMNGNRYKKNSVPKNNNDETSLQPSSIVTAHQPVDSNTTTNEQNKLIDVQKKVNNLMAESEFDKLTNKQRQDALDLLKATLNSLTEKELEDFDELLGKYDDDENEDNNIDDETDNSSAE